MVGNGASSTARVAAFLLAPVLLAAACTRDTGSEPTPAPDDAAAADGGDEPGDTEPPEPLTLEEFEAQLAQRGGLGAELAAASDEHGYLSLEASVDLFSGVFGPIPGGDPTRFSVANERSGTEAARWILYHLDDLTPEQRGAALALLDPWGEGGADASASVGTPTAVPASWPLAAEDDPAEGDLTEDELAGLVEWARGEIASRLGQDLGIRLETRVASEEEADSTYSESYVGAWATPLRGGRVVTSGRPDTCRIAVRAGIEQYARGSVAHEVFHCFQFDLVTDLSHTLGGEAWIVEGQAYWVQTEVAGLAGWEEEIPLWYEDWLCDPHRPLTERYHDAVGFYATLQNHGVDPWGVFRDMLHQRGWGAVQATGADVEVLLSRAGTGRFRSLGTGFGPEWDLTAVGIPATTCRVRLDVTEGNPVSLEAPAGPLASSGAYEIDAMGEVLSYTFAGQSGVHQFLSGQRETWTDTASGLHCLLEHCECPDGETVIEGSPHDLPLAVAMGMERAGSYQLDLEVMTVEDACSRTRGEVMIEVHGAVEQTFVGGVCHIQEGFLHVSAGFDGGPGPPRDQGLPHPDGTAFLLAQAVPGTEPLGFGHVSVSSKSGTGFIVYDSPSITKAADLLTGTFSGREVSGTYTCPSIGTREIENFDELQEERRRLGLDGGIPEEDEPLR